MPVSSHHSSELIEYLEHCTERDFMRVWACRNAPAAIRELFPDTCTWFVLMHDNDGNGPPPITVTHMHPIDEWTIFGGTR